MDIGLMYTITAFVCFMMIALIYNRVLATTYKETVDRHFCILLLFFLAFCFVDAVWGMFLSAKFIKQMLGFRLYRFGNAFFTYGFHTMAALSAFMWSGYMISYIGADRRTQKTLKYIRCFILAGQFCLLYSNLWTGAAFTFDSEGTYVTGLRTLRTVTFLVQFLYYAVLILSTLWLSLRSRENRRAYRSAIVISMIPLLFGIGQLMFPDAAMYSFGFMFSAFSIYSFNVTTQREYYMEQLAQSRDKKHIDIIRSLSGSYDTIFYVDAANGQFEAFRSGEGKTLERLDEGEHFFEDLRESIGQDIFPDDSALFAEKLSYDNLMFELAEKNEFSFRYRVNKDGQPVYYQLRCFRSDTEGGAQKLVIGVSNIDAEIREDMRKQEQLQLAGKQAEAANNAKTVFLFNMSHDIRTPMNAIIGFTDMAQKHFDDKERVADCLNKISAAGQHLLNLINDVLDMARIEAGKVELDEVPMNIREASKSTMAIAFADGARKGVEVILKEGPVGERCIYGDPLRINQIALNLLSNAVKYTNPGGKVCVRVDEVSGAEPGHLLCDMVIEDTGIGMSEEFVKHIFDPFERERNSTVSGIQGTGLGMSIVQALVQMMGGTIRIESRLGVGTKVTVRFNFRLAEDIEAPETVGEDADEARLKGKKVLLVEDNELNREIARDILEELGMIVEEAEDGTVAVRRCTEIAEKGVREDYYDFILMDVQMPIMDGYKATAEIRTIPDPQNLHVPIIAMTANAFAEDKQKALAVGMDAHLAKPISVPELVSVLLGFL